MNLVPDERVPFPAYFVRAKTKTDQRLFVAAHAETWLVFQKEKRRAKGAVMVDIDDTLIDGNEAVAHGFQFMQQLYDRFSLLFPVHVVTARPDDQHARVMALLRSRGFCVPPDRLHMLPAHLYDKDPEEGHVERFKWTCYCRIAHEHGGVVARFGDRLWDVAHLKSLDDGYLGHVRHRECYVFMDPALGGTCSYKLPG
jgi:hypothetical protein